MKLTAYFSYQFLIYLAMTIMLIPVKATSSSTDENKSAAKKTEVKVVVAENKEEDLKNDLLFRY